MNNINYFLFTKQNNNFWLTFLRISISLVTIIHFIAILPDFENLYSMEGVITYQVSDIYVPDYMITIPKIIIFCRQFGINELNTILFFKIFFLTSLGLLLIGYKQNITALIVLLLQISMTKTNPYYAYGMDFFISMSFFYLVITPKRLSSVGLSVFKRLFQLHVSMVYFFAGFDKIIGTNWWNGENIWKAINLPFATNSYDITFLGAHPTFLTIFGFLTVLLELGYPLFVWQPKISKYWIFLTILMHIGIAFVLNLYFFSAVMIIWNITLKFSFNNEKLNYNLR